MTILRYGRSRAVFSYASREREQGGQGTDDRGEGELVEARRNSMVSLTLRVELSPLDLDRGRITYRFR